MKKLQLAALALFATAAMSAQDLKMELVPTNLADSFKKSYASATNVEWEMEGKDYKVEFDLGTMENEIWYSVDGNILKTEKEISANEMPRAVASAVKTKYSDYKVDAVEMKEQNGVKTYEVEIEKGWFKERNMVIDANGKVLSDLED